MYILGIVLVIIGAIGVIGTFIWILTDNKKKNQQRQNINTRPINQNINLNKYPDIDQNINFDKDEYETNGDFENSMDDYSQDDSANICPNCHQPIQKNAKFCGSCGQRLV